MELQDELSSQNVNFRRKFTEFILIFSMFTTTYVFFRQPFEFYPHYLIFILYLPVFFIKYKIPKNITIILILVLISGLINIYLGNSEWFALIKVWGGAFLSFNFYYFVYIYFNKDIIKIFNYYLKILFFFTFSWFVSGFFLSNWI